MKYLQKILGKGKIALFSLVMTALLVPASVMGQQQSLIVCASNSSTGIKTVPAYCYEQNRLSESQFIYPNDMLENMSGSNIEAIIFKEGSSFDNLSLGGVYEVYMTVVDYTEFTTLELDWSGKTKVYTGPLSFSKSGQWYYWRIDLDVPYYYQGGNLLIGVKQTQLHVAKSVVWHGVFYEYPNAKNTAIAKGFSSTPQYQNFLPEATFIYRSGSNTVIQTPQGMTATVTGGHTATVSWDGTSNVNSWQLVCSVEPLTTDVLYGESIPENTITIEDTSYDFEGLALGTTYYVYVRGGNGTDFSLWSGVSFTTEDYYCEISYLLEDKDDDGWTGNAINVIDDNDEVLGTLTIENGSSMEGTLLLQDEKSCRFVWVSGGEHSYPNECSFVIYGPDGSVIVAITAPNAENLEDGETIATYTMNCSVPHVPVNLSVNNVTMTSAVATWEQGGEETSWNLRFGNPDDWTIIEGIEETTYTMENLSSGTTYQVQVQAVVDGVLSQWVGKEFTTSFCAPSDQCNITYSVGVSNTQYGVQWYGDVIQVVHANTNVVVGEITLVEDGPTSGELGLCNGEDYNLVWVDNSGGFPYASFTIIGPDGLAIATASTSPEVGVVASFTMDCDACMVPANLTVANLTTASATLTWEPGGEETEWLVSYRNSYGAEILNESNWTSVPDGWTAMAIGDENDLVVVEDWTLNAGSLVSNMMSFLFIPVPMGGNATITVQGDDEEAVLVGVYQGSLDEVNLQSLGSGILEQVALIGSIQTISVDLSEYEGNGYIFLFHGADGVPANLYLEHLVVYGTGDWPESIPVTGTPSFTIENLVVGTDYQVRVQAVCDDNDYSNPVLISFTTPFCDLEQQCPITYILSDGFGDGWKGYDGDPNSAINVVDAIDGSVHATLTFDDGYSYEGTLPLCPGNYDFVWVSGSYDTECSFTIYGPDGEAILSHEEGYAFPDDGLLGSYTHACPAIFTFIVEGNWDTPSNWDQNDLPQAFNNVVINAAAVIPADCVAEANYITIGTEGSLTIEDGGQLRHKNPGVVATVEKTIGGYTIANGNGDYGVTDGWYLIASPLANNVQPGNVTDMITAQQQDYDLFRYNKDAEGDFVWENYKQGHFTTLEPMQGYLYANHYGTTLKFTGEINPVDDDSYITIPDEPGFYLIGNPLVCDGYPQYYDSWGNCWYNLPYYRMNENQKELIAEVVKGAVFPGEGIFVEQVGKPLSLDVKFFTEYGYDPKKGAIALNLTKDRGAAIDRAIVRFGEGPVLSKLMLNPDNTKVSIPQGGEEYAIVRSASEGEMPVNFKAATNGSYTLNASVNDTEMEYLHLIDNLTGADIDMLETPAYTFNAKTTDYASRFKLVFKAKEDGASTSSGTFAFFNGSTWMVNNTGNAILQVVDMMGRVLTSEQINGNAKTSIEAAPGVYMMRLVNGNDVKVQKIIIK